MITFVNFKNFLNWYNKNSKIKSIDIDIDALKDEIERQASINGKGIYELSSYESINGNPCEYEFEIDYFKDEDDDICETVFTF